MNIHEQKHFYGSVILSILLHIVIAGLCYFNQNHIYETLPEEKDALTFEIVKLSDISNIKTENKTTQKEKIAKKSKKVKKTTSKKIAPSVKKKNISKNTTPKKQKTKTAKKKERIPLKKKTNPEKPKIIKKKNNTKKNPPKKKMQQEDTDHIESILNNLEAEDPTQENIDHMDTILKNLDLESDGSDTKTPTRSNNIKSQDKTNSKGAEYDENLPMSETEKSYIKKIIKQHWRQPDGTGFLDGIRVKVKMNLKKNGKITNPESTIIKCPNGLHDMCQLVEQSMLRALKQIDVIENLHPKRYNIWKDLVLDIEPGSF